ncbi:MAG: lysophospholipid acyltransferase family protein [Bryobacteraceae bacterium]|jgi:KDO2-lipid IV(A) lauroyltransferase
MSIDWLREPPNGALTGVLRCWRPALYSLRAAPLPVALRLARCYLHLASLMMPRRRRRTVRSLELAGYDAEHLEKSVIRSTARVYAAFARLNDLTAEQVPAWIRVEGEEHYWEAKARGRGVVLASGHIGNWELGAYACALLGKQLSLVVRPYPDEAYEAWAALCRMGSGNRLIAQSGAALKIRAALRRNETVAMLIDANVPPPADLEVDFLGARVRASTALARLAARTGATVLPIFVLWSEEHQRYTLCFHPPFPIAGVAGEDTRRLYALLESQVRRHPDQWFWIFDPCWAWPYDEALRPGRPSPVLQSTRGGVE